MTNLYKVQSTTSSFSIESDATHVSDLLPWISLRFLVNRLHQQTAPDNFSSDHSVPISLPSPNNRKITPSSRKQEIIRKLDKEDTMKASDSKTVINLL
jgi:hypothetical protein